jgi:Ser/Thr protein kinase RdoA (MazF antagonist)
MPGDRAVEFTKEALTKVDAFIAKHPSYSRQGVKQPGQGATNRVVFARREGELVVFKVFCQPERKARECFAYHHWQDTGLVPQLLVDIDPVTIVLSYIPGVYLHQARERDDEATWQEACLETGRAVGALTQAPLSVAQRAAFEASFYDDLGTLEAYLGRILELGLGVHARDPDFQGFFWRQSLDFVKAQLDHIFSQPRILYHQDVSNLHVQSGQFMGFFDLEMCRVGCAAMQLAAALGMLAGERAAWEPFCRGWERATGQSLTVVDLNAATAAHQLLQWREICRYLSYDGTPGTGYEWAQPADPAWHRRIIEAAADMMGVQWRQG